MKSKLVLVALAMLASSTFPAAAHASPPPSLVYITPDTDLVDGQTVMVDLVRFPALAHGTIVECRAPKVYYQRPAGGTCGVGTRVKVTTDANGELVNPNYTLKETFTDHNGSTIHCSTAPPTPYNTACVLFVKVQNKVDGRVYGWPADLPFAS